jgi:mannitol-1-phosphate/altronate dehydrogenase
MAEDNKRARFVTHWLPASNDVPVDCLCVGTGRFLRAVLVPALTLAGLHPVLIQTRGRNFLEYMQTHPSGNSYPVDTVLPSGDILTEDISCYGAFSWGQSDDKQAFYDWFATAVDSSLLRVLGVGVTEAGLASPDTPVMKDLYHFLLLLSTKEQQTSPTHKLCVINTDNVPHNGAVLQKHMETLAHRSEDQSSSKLLQFLKEHVVFLDSMVDRITSQRPDSKGMIPRAEPLPAKALVLLDIHQDLPLSLSKNSIPGVVIRSTPNELETDIALKLRIANGTHTAVAHALALLKCPMTDALSAPGSTTALLLLDYLDALVQHQIVKACDTQLTKEAQIVYQDWRRRLTHPYFGLSTFFITQNGPAKGGIRLGPTVQDLVATNQPLTVTMAFCFAVLLRWLTPVQQVRTGIYRGWLQGASRGDVEMSSNTSRTTANKGVEEEYADQLCYNLQEGWYDFRCTCPVYDDDQNEERNLSDWLGELTAVRRVHVDLPATHPHKFSPGADPYKLYMPAKPLVNIVVPDAITAAAARGSLAGCDYTATQQPAAFQPAVRAYLKSTHGGNLNECPDALVRAVATLYQRMVKGEELLVLLQEMNDCKGVYTQGMATDCQVLGRIRYATFSSIANTDEVWCS